MDEQRVQAYLSLIQELLECPRGEVNSILKRQREQIDVGFLQQCRVVAEQLQARGEANQAQFLRDLAQQLGEYVKNQSSGMSNSASQPKAAGDEYHRFLMQVLQATSKSRGNPSVVYPILQQNLGKLDVNLAQILRLWASQFFSQSDKIQTIRVAADIGQFANLIQNFSLGSQSNNLEIAISGYEIIATVFTKENDAKMWAINQTNLGNSYIKRIQGERADNLEKAIAVYQAALEVYTREVYPEKWAETQVNLGIAYSNRILGKQGKNLNVAVSYYQTALGFYPHEEFPQQWERINNLLNEVENKRNFIFLMEVLQATSKNHVNPSVIYSILRDNQDNLTPRLVEVLRYWANQNFRNLNVIQLQNIAKILVNFSGLICQFPLGNRWSNVEIAIAGYELALTIFTREAYPQQWARTQNDLGAAYGERIRGDRAENLEREIAACQAALEVFTRVAYPTEWATVNGNLGAVYGERIRGERSENLEMAIACLNSSLEVQTRQVNPQAWADTQNNLGIIYLYRIQGERADNIEVSIAACEAALEFYTREAYPEKWAMVQMNIGNAYTQRIRGEKAENIELSIAACEAALEVSTREAAPEQWARSKANLGNVYTQRIRGEKAENIELSIAACEAALEVYTHEEFPGQWATTQRNLGTAYQQRIWGKRSQNLEFSIAAYENALRVYTREAFPEQWATTQRNLGTAYQQRIRGERSQNLELSIICYEATLEVYTREAFPLEWAVTQGSLGISYRERIQGYWVDNVERSIACYEAALEVFTLESFPQEWAGTQINLANAYTDRRGDQANNVEKSIVAYKSALEVYTRKAFPEDWARIQTNLGNAYLDRIQGQSADNQEQAIACHKAALEVRTRKAFPEQWANTQNNLGNAYKNRIQGERSDNIEQSIAYYKAALQVYTRTAFPEKWAMIQNNLGYAYIDRVEGDRANNLEEAIAACKGTLDIYTRTAFPQEWASTQNHLAMAYSDRIWGEREQNLGQAIRLYKKALEVRTRVSFPQKYTATLNNLGLVYQAQSQHYTSNATQKKNALDNAYVTFADALDTFEYLRGEVTSGDQAQRKLNEKWGRLYRSMVEVCLELGRYTDTIEYADRSKARNLTELIATRDAYPEGDIPAEVRQRLQELRQAISEEDRRLQQDPNPDYTHISQLREEFQAKYPYKPLKFADIQSLLDDETVILEWYVLNDKCLIFTLTKQTLNLWQSSQEDRQNLIDWTGAYIDDYIDNNSQWRKYLPQRLEQLAQILHLDEILQNLRQQFPNCQKLILIPHRFLHLFPFHALPIATEDGKGKLLQDLFPKGVAYAPNCQVLKQAQNRQRPHFNQLFAIQNPTQDLQFTDMEVEAIQSLFNPHQVLKHDQAEKAAIDAETLKNAHCTHFSCHGYFNFQDALKSALILAKSEFTPPPPTDDPSRYLPLKDNKLLDLQKCLTLEDILRLDLTNCRLVTLSACETGITDITSTSDEYIGLPSGFILAGSPNVVSTLWAVADISTAILMIQFYQTLQQQSELSVVLALQQTQKWLREATVQDLLDWTDSCAVISPERRKEMKKRLTFGAWKNKLDAKRFESPYYWAAFCAIGA